MTSIVRNIAAQLTGALKGGVARGAVATFLLRGFNIATVLVLNLIVARMLGAEGYGAYAFALTCVTVLTAPALLGFDGLLLREVAVHHARSEWGLLRGLLSRSTQASVAASLGLAALAALLALSLEVRLGPLMLTSVWVALLALPLVAIIRIRQSTMLGLQNVLIGQVPEAVVQPVLFGTGLTIVLVWHVDVPNPPTIVALHVAAVLAIWPVSSWLLRRSAPAELRRAAPDYRTSEWIRSAWPFGLTASFNLFNLGCGVILLGLVKGPEAAGIFAVANSGAQLVGLPLMAIAVPLAPAAARAFAARSQDELQLLATKSARAAVLMAVPIVLLYILFGRELLSWFGVEFRAGYAALIILTVGHAANAMLGAVGALLQMAKLERAVAWGLGSSAAANFALCIGLIPGWGLEGAAIAGAAAMIGWNVFLAFGVRHWLGIRPTAFG